tara:strand:+ start:37 stop:216 length:180 start_codon:yes stop_codon:yes gene_type:complete
MEEDEDIKKSSEKEQNYEDFDVDQLINEINIVKKQLKYLENLLKNKKSSHNKANKIFKK